MSDTKAPRRLWHHFKKSFNKPMFYDPETGLETYPVWIFWVLGGCSIWGILFGI